MAVAMLLQMLLLAFCGALLGVPQAAAARPAKCHGPVASLGQICFRRSSVSRRKCRGGARCVWARRRHRTEGLIWVGVCKRTTRRPIFNCAPSSVLVWCARVDSLLRAQCKCPSTPWIMLHAHGMRPRLGRMPRTAQRISAAMLAELWQCTGLALGA